METKSSVLFRMAMKDSFEDVKKYIDHNQLSMSNRHYVKNPETKKILTYEGGFLQFYLQELKKGKPGSCTIDQLKTLCYVYAKYIEDKLLANQKSHVKKEVFFECEEKVLEILKGFQTNLDQLRNGKEIPEEFLAEIHNNIKMSFATFSILKTLSQTKDYLTYDTNHLCMMLFSRVAATTGIAKKLDTSDKATLQRLSCELMKLNEEASIPDRFSKMLETIVTTHNNMQSGWLFANLDKIELEKILRTVLELVPGDKLDNQAFLTKAKGNLILHEMGDKKLKA